MFSEKEQKVKAGKVIWVYLEVVVVVIVIIVIGIISHTIFIVRV